MTDFNALLRLLVANKVEFITVKLAAGRPKDLEVVAELQQIRDETRQ